MMNKVSASLKMFAIACGLLLAVFGASFSYAQQEIKGMKQQVVFEVDEVGDAAMTLTMKMNAMQWDNFKRAMGGNQAEFRRMVERGVPTVYLTDFQFSEDQMNRVFEFKMKGKCMAALDKNGKWKADLEGKDPDVTKLNDREYHLGILMMTNGGLIDQKQIIKLPKNVKTSKIAKDSFGKAVLTYELGANPLHRGVQMAGGALILLGLGIPFAFGRGK